MFVFFFKQKTAYELRISDWSSDVCSSDLPPERTDDRARQEERQKDGNDEGDRQHDAETQPLCPYGAGNVTCVFGRQQHRFARPQGNRRGNHGGAVRRIAEHGDRKSVVSGKSASVRVDLGGRRNNQQTNSPSKTDVNSEF